MLAGISIGSLSSSLILSSDTPQRLPTSSSVYPLKILIALKFKYIFLPLFILPKKQQVIYNNHGPSSGRFLCEGSPTLAGGGLPFSYCFLEHLFQLLEHMF